MGQLLRNTVLHFIRLDTVYTAKQHRYLRVLRLTLTLPILILIHATQCNTINTNMPGTHRRCAIRMPGASRPTVTQYNVKIHKKKTRLIITVRKKRELSDLARSQRN